MKKIRKIDFIKIIVFAILTGIVFASKVRLLFVGMDVDEQYATTLAYRIALDDSPILEMWEPHQLSAFLPGIFAKLWLEIVGIDSFFAFMRVLGIAFQFFVSLCTFLALKREYGNSKAFLASLIVFAVLPKWIQAPEFANQQIWWVVLTILCLYKASERPILYGFFAGLSMSLDVLAYPSAIFVFFVFSLILYVKKERNLLISFAGTCLSAGSLLIIFLINRIGTKKLFECISFILSDSSHSETIGNKAFRYLQDFAVICSRAAVYICLAILFTCFVMFVLSKRRMTCSKIRIWKRVVNVFLMPKEYAFFEMSVMSLSIIDMYRVILFSDKSLALEEIPFFIGFLLFLINYIKEPCRNKAIWLYGALASFLSVMALTNLDLPASIVHLFPALLGLLLSQDRGSYMPKILGIWVASVCVLICFFERWNEGMYPGLFETKQKALYGACRGIYMEYIDGYKYNECYNFLNNNVKKESSMLYIGWDNYMYSIGNYRICSASVICTSDFGKNYVDYYSVNPHKMPEVVIIDSGYENAEVSAWVEQNYKDSGLDSTYISVYMR